MNLISSYKTEFELLKKFIEEEEEKKETEKVAKKLADIFIKGMVREGIGNVILPYYAVYKDIKKGDFKVISKIDEVKDGYELIITKDKKDLSQITKFINIVKKHKIVMESIRH